MRKNKGFTLVEMLVAVAITILTVGGGVVYINNFSNRQSQKSARDEIISNIKLARNLAISNQKAEEAVSLPQYVRVGITTEGVMTAVSSDGFTYFSRDLTDDRVTVTVTGEIWFQAYEGRLVKLDGDSRLVPVGSSETRTIDVAVGGSGIYYRITISPSGSVGWQELTLDID